MSDMTVIQLPDEPGSAAPIAIRDGLTFYVWRTDDGRLGGVRISGVVDPYGDMRAFSLWLDPDEIRRILPWLIGFDPEAVAVTLAAYRRVAEAVR